MTSSGRGSNRSVPSREALPLSRRIDQLTARVDRLQHQLEDLAQLVRGQNDLLQRLRAESGPNGSAPPPARLAGDVDPAGPSEREGYAHLVIRIRALVRSVVPAGSNVLVVSKGDEELLLLEGRRGWHFPQLEGGVYAGHHPADGEKAIKELESMRRWGAQFLVLPATAFWWLDHYPELAVHLTARYRLALHRQDACLIFDLRSANGEEGR